MAKSQPSRLRREPPRRAVPRSRPAARRARRRQLRPRPRSKVSTRKSRPATAASRNNSVQLGGESIESTTDDLTYSLGNRPPPFRRRRLVTRSRTPTGGGTPGRKRVAVRLLVDRRHEIRSGVELGSRPHEPRDIPSASPWRVSRVAPELGGARAASSSADGLFDSSTSRYVPRITVRCSAAAWATKRNNSSVGASAAWRSSRINTKGRLCEAPRSRRLTATNSSNRADSGDPDTTSGGVITRLRISGRSCTMWGSMSSAGAPAS